MSGVSVSNDYHKVTPPSERIQKRLVLNQCFRLISESLSKKNGGAGLTYVTFGGATLTDVLDFFSVFDIRKGQYSVLSFEECQLEANQANISAVKKAIGMRVDVQVVNGDLGVNLDKLSGVLEKSRKIFFLDFTDHFCTNAHKHQGLVEQLLNFRFLEDDDYLIITSALDPRTVTRPNFMKNYVGKFCDYFSVTEGDVDQAFKIRNYVDLLVAETFVNYGYITGPEGFFLVPKLMNKYRYRDSKIPMGKWVFEIRKSSRCISVLDDMQLDEYPWPEADVDDTNSGFTGLDSLEI